MVRIDPARADLSRLAIEKAVNKETLMSPLSLYPVAIGVIGAVGLLLFREPMALYVSLVGFLAGATAFVVNRYFRYDSLARRYLDSIHKQIKQQTLENLANLERELKELKCNEGVMQLPKLKEKFGRFNGILDRKFDQGEITYGRYLAMGEQVYLNAMDNLNKITEKLYSVSAIDEGYIRYRLQALKSDNSNKARDEEKSLGERLKIFQDMQNEVMEIITANEEAMTKLDQTTSALANIQTRGGKAVMDMDFAMEELAELANRTKIYDNRRSEGAYGGLKIQN